MIRNIRKNNQQLWKKTRNINNNNNNTDKKQTINFPLIPKIGRKMKKYMQKFGFRVEFQMGPNLKIKEENEE